MRISLHVIGESKSLDLIRIAGQANVVPVMALIDSGSTHSFVDNRKVGKAGYSASKIKAMVITAANGGKMHCEEKFDG